MDIYCVDSQNNKIEFRSCAFCSKRVNMSLKYQDFYDRALANVTESIYHGPDNEFDNKLANLGTLVENKLYDDAVMLWKIQYQTCTKKSYFLIPEDLEWTKSWFRNLSLISVVKSPEDWKALMTVFRFVFPKYEKRLTDSELEGDDLSGLEHLIQYKETFSQFPDEFRLDEDEDEEEYVKKYKSMCEKVYQDLAVLERLIWNHPIVDVKLTETKFYGKSLNTIFREYIYVDLDTWCKKIDELGWLDEYRRMDPHIKIGDFVNKRRKLRSHPTQKIRVSRFRGRLKVVE